MKRIRRPATPARQAPKPPEVVYVELLAALEAERVARDAILLRKMAHPR